MGENILNFAAKGEMQMSERILAACGNDCSVCPRYIKEPYVKTEIELAHTAELWYKIGYRDGIE